MRVTEEMLSAYLDGELSREDAAALEAVLAVDGDLQGQLAALIEADQAAHEDFAAMLDEPVPDALVAAILEGETPAAAPAPDGPPPPPVTPQPEPAPAPLPEPANSPNAPSMMRGLGLAAAVVGALMIGGAGGLYLGGIATQPGATQGAEVAGWIADIADYHAVYATQTRHLVEVPAEEAAHIQTWLSATLGTEVVIPDLADQGLTFEGARLLVAAGRPVAQLLYTDADGAVVALCQIQSDSPQLAARQDTLGGFDLISWGGTGANYVIVTDEGRGDLRDIVEAASGQV